MPVTSLAVCDCAMPLQRYRSQESAKGQNLPFQPSLSNVRNGPESGHGTDGVGCPLLTLAV